jgi:hypothetical protein
VEDRARQNAGTGVELTGKPVGDRSTGMALACRHAWPSQLDTLREEVAITEQSVVTASRQILLAADNPASQPK